MEVECVPTIYVRPLVVMMPGVLLAIYPPTLVVQMLGVIGGSITMPTDSTDRRRPGLLHTIRSHAGGDGPHHLWILISYKDDLCHLYAMCIYHRRVCTNGDGPCPPLYEYRKLLFSTAHRGRTSYPVLEY